MSWRKIITKTKANPKDMISIRAARHVRIPDPADIDREEKKGEEGYKRLK